MFGQYLLYSHMRRLEQTQIDCLLHRFLAFDFGRVCQSSREESGSDCGDAPSLALLKTPNSEAGNTGLVPLPDS